MAEATLCIDRGARRVTREEVLAVPCPQPAGRWKPISHGTCLQLVEELLGDAQFAIDKAEFALSRNEGQKFWATLVLNHALAKGVALAVGIASSTDQSMSLRACFGSHVFACSNGCFRSTVLIAHKHTLRGDTRYAEGVARAVKQLPEFAQGEAAVIQRLKDETLDPDRADALLLRLYEEGILSSKTLPQALAEWRVPSVPAFESERSLWGMQNAVTAVLKPRAITAPGAFAQLSIRLSSYLLN